MWIDKASELDPGESVFLLADSRDHSRSLTKDFRKEIKILSQIDPVKASKLVARPAVREQKYWVEIAKEHGSPLIGFVKRNNGTVERIEISDPDRMRRLRMMKEDGFDLDNIEDIEGELSDDERNQLGFWD
jgi:hypothetical protein